MSEHYDRDGKPIDFMEWVELHSDLDYKTVEQTHIDDKTLLSTAWFGLDYSFGSGPPLIFETMLFVNHEEQYCERYSTLKEAQAGHAKKLNELKIGAR